MARSADGPVFFVPRTAPGEAVEAEIVETHSQWVRARAARILTQSPDRRPAPCPYYERCGACQLQHLSYDAQRRAKAGIVADCLRRLGGLEIAPPDVVPSPSEFEYRNRITFVLRRDPPGVRAGYHALAAVGQLVDVDSCPLGEPALNRAWAALRAAWGKDAERLPAGRELRLTLRANEIGEVGLVIEGGEGSGRPELLLEQVDALVVIWRLDRSGEIAWRRGVPALSDRWGEDQLLLIGDAFLQVNRQVAEKLEQHVLETCGDVAGLQVVDAYCGLGRRGLELARRGARVVGIDSDAAAIAAADRVAAESGVSARFVRAQVEQALLGALPAQLVVLNPPRRGVSATVVKAIRRRPPDRIIYVSCDPATLARDLRRLGEAFELSSCHAFDMFPQTAHVETVVTLTRK